MTRALAIAATALLAIGPTVQAQDFAIVNATVALGDGSEPIPNASVVVQGGRVVAAGAGIDVPINVETIDAKGGWATPGIVAALTDLGLWDVDAVSQSNDVRASSAPFSAALDAAPAINPASQHIAVSRAGGVTRAGTATLPSGSIFGGQGAIIDLGSDNDAVTRARAFQFVTLGEEGARIAGGSRTAAQALLRNALNEARMLGSAMGVDMGGTGGALVSGGPSRSQQGSRGDDRLDDFRLSSGAEERGADVLLTRFDAAALVPVVTGQQRLYVQVERAADIRTVLRLRDEFPRLDMVLVGASEGWLVADAIAAAGVPVIADPLDDLPASFEQLAATQSNVGRMVAAGVQVALSTLSFPEQPRNAAHYAGNLVALSRVPGATGLSWGQALATVTSAPAQISGLGANAGTLAAGARADIVLWSGDPLELASIPQRVFIDGVDQPLDNHQTRLRDRYRTLDESALPKGYNW